MDGQEDLVAPSAEGKKARRSKTSGVLLILVTSWAGAIGVGPHGLFGVWGQQPLDDEPVVTVEEIDQGVRAHLEQAQQFLAARQWAEAVEMLRGVMDGHGERLIYLPDPADVPLRRYVPVRLWGQLQLMRWGQSAPPALHYFQTAVEERAARLWHQVEQGEDERAWRELLDSYFLTTYGARAAWRWAERLLERGHTIRARGWWERLHPAMRTPVGVPGLPSGRPFWLFLPQSPAELPAWVGREAPVTDDSVFLAHTSSPFSLAELRACAVLASLAEGHLQRAEHERSLLRQQFPGAQGTLAGKTGLWTELLDQLTTPQPLPQRPLPTWSTFAASTHRNAVAAKEADPGGQVLWRLRLPRVRGDGDRLAQLGRMRIAEDESEILAYFPVVMNDDVWIVQANGIRAVDLRSGRPAFRGDAAGGGLPENVGMVYELPRYQLRLATSEVSYWGVPRYTATVFGSRIWAWVGSAVTRGPALLDAAVESPSWIVSLDGTAQGRLVQGYPLEAPGREWTFDGTPVVDGQRVYVFLRRQDELRAEAAVAAFDAATGRLCWLRSLCTADSPGQGRWNERTHNLLTLHQGLLFCNTNLGVVAAVDAESGRLEWISRYPRVPFQVEQLDGEHGHFFRSLNPVVVYHDLLVVAPTDSDRLFALDAFTGQTLWCTPPGVAADAVHLLGVVRGTLVASGDYLYWFDVRNGRLRCQFPPPLWTRPGYARPAPRGYGRGLLTEETILWPTRDALYVFRIEPGTIDGVELPVPAGNPRWWSWYDIRGGNLVPAGDVLLIAGATELVALQW